MDRNDNGNPVAVSDLESLSARRAWIEISTSIVSLTANTVALRKESVDRNQRIAKPFREQFKSLSARRAWIEIIILGGLISILLAVALRKESVDRNFFVMLHLLRAAGRSPQGERG